jgi:hypothetical protein
MRPSPTRASRSGDAGRPEQSLPAATGSAPIGASRRHVRRLVRRSHVVGTIVVAVAVAAMLLILLWAGVGHPSPSAAGPGDAVKAARWAANRGHYAEANRHLSKAMLALAERHHADLVAVWDMETHGGQIRRITIDKTTVRGGDALVDYTITFADGTTATDTARLVRENGAWKEAPAP